MKKIIQKFNFLYKINDLFNKKEKIHFLFVLILSIISSLFQALGIISILPFMSIIMNSDLIYSNFFYFYVYNLFNFTSEGSYIFFVGLFVLSIIILGNLISALNIWVKTSFIWGKEHKLSVSLLKKYLSLPYIYFLDRNTADLGKNILVEVGNLMNGFLFPFLRILSDIIMILVILATLLFVNFKITLIASVVLITAYVIIYIMISFKLKSKGVERLEENKRRFETANEALGGIKDVKLLGRELYFLHRFSKHSHKYSQLIMWSDVVGQTPRYIMEIFAFGGVITLILFLFSSGFLINEIIPLVSFFVFAGYRLMPALQDAFNSFTVFRFNKVVLDSIHKDMLEDGIYKEKKILNEENLKSMIFENEVALENINFHYPNTHKKVLNGISLNIKKKTSIAIVGSTGSGKTTLVDIILGLLSPQEGQIKIDGVEINYSNIRNWQANLGYVPQQIYLSDDTLTRNIAFGVPDHLIDNEQVKMVAKMASIDDFIENDLKDSYNTIIGERGIRLSGGQRQRIGIARALYNDPKVLVFDEATSSLDNVTEDAVLDSIERISKFKTMIIVAHRLTTIKKCDIVYLLDKGKLVASGTYEDLIKTNDQFKIMAKKF
ncbi:MAG: ATP-binding cassette domain-containing protein [Candidatus Magasanikbacteria bacterium]